MKGIRHVQLEYTWLLRHLQLTNQAIVPVLNSTRLKLIKNSSPFKEDRESNGVQTADGDVEKSRQVVEIMELGDRRKVCKPIVALDDATAAKVTVVEVVAEIAKLLEQFFDV